MRNSIKTIFLVVLAVLLIGCVEKQITPSVNEEKLVIKVSRSLPSSLELYYKSEPVYLYKMYTLEESMQRLTINQNDRNAKKYFDNFSQLYKESSNLVPEWQGLYDLKLFEELEKSINARDSDNISSILEDIRKICENCHKETRPFVWARYHWKDFRNMTIGTEPFIFVKKRLASNFYDASINIREGDQKKALEILNQFDNIFYDMETICLQCHNQTPDNYQTIKNKINDTRTNISTGRLEDADKTMLYIRDSCYKCHVIHEPLQRIRESFDKN